MASSDSSTRGSGYRAKALLFIGGIVVGLLAGDMIRAQRAVAQIPDAGKQRAEVHRQSIETNRLLKDILNVLRNDTLKVQVVEPAKPLPPKPAPLAPKP